MHIFLCKYEPQRQKLYLLICAHIVDSGQHAHSQSLIRIFTGHTLNSQRYKDFSLAERRLIKLDVRRYVFLNRSLCDISYISVDCGI